MSGFGTRTTDELPSENAWGKPLEWVWVVYRPAKHSDLGREELLGAHENPESAEAHARRASIAGECAVKEMPLKDGTSPLLEEIET